MQVGKRALIVLFSFGMFAGGVVGITVSGGDAEAGFNGGTNMSRIMT